MASGGGRVGGRTDASRGREQRPVRGVRAVSAGVPHEPPLLIVALVDAHDGVVDGSRVPRVGRSERKNEAGRGRRARAAAARPAQGLHRHEGA